MSSDPMHIEEEGTQGNLRSDPTGSEQFDDLTPQSVQNLKVYKEPLKVCLDDDSSCDSDDEMDDAYFFGDDEDFAAMANDLSCYGSSSVYESSPASACHSSTSSSNPAPMVIAVSDDGLSGSEESSASLEKSRSAIEISSMSGPHLHSTGNLTHVSEDSTNSFPKRTKTKRRVSLHDDVCVIPIPMRNEYSDTVKGKLWSSATELFQNATRNSIEFASEGWNWRNVMEDEQMWKCNESGELIHPIHVQNAQPKEAEQKVEQNSSLSEAREAFLTSAAQASATTA